MIRKIVERLAAKAGLIVVPDWRAVRLDEERFLRRLITQYRIDCIFDVGANVGQYGHMLREYVGYRGQIISFEPNPHAFLKLQTRAGNDPLWKVEPIALGALQGELEFNAFEISELGSFREFNEGQLKPSHIGSKKIKVQVDTLENYLSRMADKWTYRSAFLKMDTQGYDAEVIQGAQGVLDRFVGLQSEIAFQNLYAGAPHYKESLRMYEDAGFVIGRLVPNHEIHFPELVEMDVIMVRPASKA